jgi:rhamnosyltransferase
LFLGDNFGIAAALNAGIASACNQGFSWVITLDQDSMPDADMVQRLLATLTESGEQRVALVGPTLLDAQAHTQLQKSSSHPDAENNTVRPVTLMTSGCLTSVLCWKEVGGFRDDLFIDYVDHEYCLRCASHKWWLLQSSAVLNHKLGAMRTHYLFGRIAFNVTHHSVGRRYYMTRNRMILWVMYGACHPKWVAFDVRLFFLELIKIILVEKEKFRKIAAVALGARDFFCRNLGRRTYKLF